MRAALLTRLNSPLEVADILWNGPHFGQVYVQVTCSGICGAQLMEIRGDKESGPHPHPLGHEGVGIVRAIGDGVTTVKEGDKVILHWRKGAGMESDFPRFETYGGEFTTGKVTTFSDYTVVSENRCTAVPDEVPDELCAMLGCGLSTALGVIEHEAKLRMGESVLIIGCGGLGLNLILAAKLAQASAIIVSDIYEEKQKAAMNAGATAFICTALREFPSKSGDVGYSQQSRVVGCFNVIIDTSGDVRAIAAAMPLLAPTGRFIMVGQPKSETSIVLTSARHLFEGEGKTIKATQGGFFRPETDIPRYVAMWRSGLLRIDGLITHRVPLERINDGIDLVRNGQAGRVLVTMGTEP